GSHLDRSKIVCGRGGLGWIRRECSGRSDGLNYQFNFAPVIENFDQLIYGALITIELTFGAILIGTLIAVPCAIAKTAGPKPLVWLVNVYVEVIRNTPFLIQIFFIYFSLPALGVRFDPNTAALIALSVNVGAYATEIVRAGIEAISHGQVEAGRALGLRGFQIFRYIVLKPAIRTIYPALTSQ